MQKTTTEKGLWKMKCPKCLSDMDKDNQFMGWVCECGGHVSNSTWESHELITIHEKMDSIIDLINKKENIQLPEFIELSAGTIHPVIYNIKVADISYFQKVFKEPTPGYECWVTLKHAEVEAIRINLMSYDLLCKIFRPKNMENY